MNFENLFCNYDIESQVRFNKKMMTVFELSYFLIDYQAVINNLTEIIFNNEKKVKLIEEKFIRHDDFEKRRIDSSRVLQREHPEWQKEIEENIESFIFEPNRKVADFSLRATLGFKQTTSRRFNEKYQMNLKLNSFSEGSLILDLANSLLVSILTEFLKELVIQKTGNKNAINIKFYNNQYIFIDAETVKRIPKGSCISNAIKVNSGSNQNQLDVQKCIHDVVDASKPDENIEESVKRLLLELEKCGVVNKQIIYDERGIKTAVRDIERFKGNFVDNRI